MSENKSRDIFYGVVAIATLIVALIGATLAYFSITANSKEGAVNAKADIVSISYDSKQQVTAQADELIPSSFVVVQKAYAKNKDSFGNEGALEKNVCVDDNDRQVCSIYRFTVESDSDRQMIATLNNELNTFTTGLSYAIYDVSGVYTCNSSEKEQYGTEEKCIESKRWQILDDTQSSKKLTLTSCKNSDEDKSNNCFTMNEGKKEYNTAKNASNSIFGYTTEGIKAKAITAHVKQVYDLVIFLNESGGDQNADQGAEYQGTIIVTIVDSSVGNGKITGEIKD